MDLRVKDNQGTVESVVAGRDVRLGGEKEVGGCIAIVPQIIPIHFWLHVIVVLLMLAGIWRQTMIFHEFDNLKSMIQMHVIHESAEGRK